jgi:hypothetical protein
VLAGCGSSNPTAQFKAGYDAARGPLNATFIDVNNTLTSTRHKSTGEIAARVGVLAARFRNDLAPLDALKPPARLATAFTTLTSSLKRAESDLRAITVAANHRSFAGALLAIQNFDSDSRSATDAAIAIKQKLYTS